MKKLIALILSLCMVLFLTACSNVPGKEKEDDHEAVGQDVRTFEPAAKPTGQTKELPHYKIAFSYATFTDKLGMQFKNAIQYLCDAYNCEVVFFETGMGEEGINNIESVLAAGDIDGIITVGGTPAYVAVAQKYNVPYVMTCGFPSLPEEVEGISKYDVFLGGVVDNDVWAGTRCIEALYEAGVRNFCFSGLTLGLGKSHDDRAHAMKDFISAHTDMKLLADSYTMAEWANDVGSFAAAYPDLEGIAFSAMGDAVYQALETEGLADGSVKISGVDIASQTGTYFQKGVQVWTCGGQYGSAMVAWSILYNYLADGTRIIKDTKQPIIRPYIEITSYEDYKNYVKYVEDPLPVYTAEEIGKLIHAFNSEANYDTYVKYAEDYTLEDIIARHGELIGK